MTLTDSAVSNNSGRNGGGIKNDNGGTLTVTNSTIGANQERGGLVCLNSAARFDKWNHAAVS